MVLVVGHPGEDVVVEAAGLLESRRSIGDDFFHTEANRIVDKAEGRWFQVDVEIGSGNFSGVVDCFEVGLIQIAIDLVLDGEGDRRSQHCSLVVGHPVAVHRFGVKFDLSRKVPGNLKVSDLLMGVIVGNRDPDLNGLADRKVLDDGLVLDFEGAHHLEGGLAAMTVPEAGTGSEEEDHREEG